MFFALLLQIFLFPTDSMERGYCNRPYERYEAEPAYCITDGEFLPASDNQRDLQSEASHQQAVTLDADGESVSWVVASPGNGLTLRFSLPDNAVGTGCTGDLTLYAGSDSIASLHLSSYWAWQYCTDNYPGNTPKTGNVVIRMRFDETHLLLPRTLQTGDTLRLVKTNGGDSIPFTIDFVELESVPEPVVLVAGGDTVVFDGNGDVGEFIMNNQGKCIYVPAGRWETAHRIYLNRADSTRVIGAGMWYTEIFFSADPASATEYSYRGFSISSNAVLVEGLYLNTINNCRYREQNSSQQVGKAFQGGCGTNSIIRSVWEEHFECGGWIADYSGNNNSRNLLVEHCRLRNNYADGINFCKASNGHIIRFCSLRNNGDDDLASWTTDVYSTNLTFAYCTAENNWRASSLGIFGGKNITAHHLYLADGLECGLRVNADFSGKGFSQSGEHHFSDITIDHCGCVAGTKGKSGDFWGNAQGALNIGGTQYYPIYNVHFHRIDVLASRWNALYIHAGSNTITGLSLDTIHVDGGNYGIYFVAVGKSEATWCDLQIENTSVGKMNAYPANFSFVERCGGETALTDIVPDSDTPAKYLIDGQLVVVCRGVSYTGTGMPLNVVCQSDK